MIVSNFIIQMSIGVQSCLSESGSFIEDDHPEQLTIQGVDMIKLMADVEEDVKKTFIEHLRELEDELKKKEDTIQELRTQKVTIKFFTATDHIYYISGKPYGYS